MNIGSLLSSCREKVAGLGKYKYALLVLLIGVGLMIYPFGEKKEIVQTDTKEIEVSMEQKLETVLNRVDGVGSVMVLLSVKEDFQYSYQVDEHTTVEEQQHETDLETVLLVDENGAEAPVIKNTRYPVYEGAVVVCEGADSPSVRLNVVNAVSDLTGLGSDKISVIKMKGN